MSEESGPLAPSRPPRTTVQLHSTAQGLDPGAAATDTSAIDSYRADPWVITTGPAHASLIWHEKVYHHMHSHRVHVVLMVLLGLDVLISIISVILEIEYLKSEISDYEHIVDICQDALSTSESSAASYCLAHDDVGNASIEGGQEALAVLSLIILFIFLLESTILLASNPISFFSSPMYSIDLIVVVISIFLEFYLQGGAEGGILTVERFWRFARISHGVYDESKPDIDATRLLDTLEKLYQRHEGLDRMAEFSPKGERIDAEALVDERYASKVLEKVGTEAAAEVVAAVSWYLERKKAQEIT